MTGRQKKLLAAVLVGGGILLAALVVGIPWARVALDDDAPSRSIGRLSGGRLAHGHVFRPWGPGYTTYSLFGSMLGMQYAHGAVRDAVTAAFAARAAAVPDQTYVLGEASAPRGGPHHGHLTHQNGLSIDIFMPVLDAAGTRTRLPTWPWHLLGYGWEFDARGENVLYRIDFPELAALLVEIGAQAAARGIGIERVIIAPEYVPLIADGVGPLGDKLTRRAVEVRHDEHVHIDFTVMR